MEWFRSAGAIPALLALLHNLRATLRLVRVRPTLASWNVRITSHKNQGNAAHTWTDAGAGTASEIDWNCLFLSSSVWRKHFLHKHVHGACTLWFTASVTAKEPLHVHGSVFCVNSIILVGIAVDTHLEWEISRQSNRLLVLLLVAWFLPP